MLFGYGSDRAELFEVSAEYNSYFKELVIYYVYNLETASYEFPKNWPAYVEDSLRTDIIKKLKKNIRFTDLEFNN